MPRTNLCEEPVESLSPLPCSFFAGNTESLARRLLGKALVRRLGRGLTGGIIVETEAYLPAADPACHAATGKTPRNTTMFAAGGTLYVYTIHAKHCLNVVSEKNDVGSAVLIRALQPVWGISLMQRRRQRTALDRLTSGPGMLCQSLAVDLRANGADLTIPTGIWIAETSLRIRDSQIVATPRIGISKGKLLPLRFFVNRNRFVSGRRQDHHGKADQEFRRDSDQIPIVVASSPKSPLGSN